MARYVPDTWTMIKYARTLEGDTGVKGAEILDRVDRNECQPSYRREATWRVGWGPQIMGVKQNTGGRC